MRRCEVGGVLYQLYKIRRMVRFGFVGDSVYEVSFFTVTSFETLGV